MSTRGIYGIRKNNVDKTTYNHSDSYPSGLGVQVVEFFADADLVKLGEVFDSIQLVKHDDIVTEDIAETIPAELSNFEVNGGQKTFYCYLRNAQGELSAYLKGLKYMIDKHDFIADSLFCEWGYIVNLDTGKLEVWQGYQKSPTEGNRYGVTPNEDGYYPCKMVAEFTQEEIKAGDFAKFVEANG
jgi:hypothetical protein